MISNLITDPNHWESQCEKLAKLKVEMKAKIAQVRASQQKPNTNIVCMDGGIRQQALQAAIAATGRGVTL